jgi:rubrerythrin
MPIRMERVSKKETSMEILRVAIMAELDAISLYEQLAAETDYESIRKVLLDVAGEEKTHVGEFQALLLEIDAAQAEELAKGREEVKKLTGK